MSVLVFGSLNMDLVVLTPRSPLAGETLIGHTFFTTPGGKGANQAVAAARLGASTAMVGRVGADLFGSTLLQQLSITGVKVEGVITDSEQLSGVALITLDDMAQNRIIVVPGANGAIGSEDLTRLSSLLTESTVLLLQLEIPLEVVTAAAQLAVRQGLKVILDPAPALPLPPELYQATTILTPNETEAAVLVGFPLSSDEAIIAAAKELHQRGAGTVIIKLGSRGIYWTDGLKREFRSALPVRAIDTVGAGDAFNGALAVALAEGKDLNEALNWGLVAGSLATTKTGAQAAMPEREALYLALTSLKN
ncbi:MAG: ribokinase [Chloroflexota bacterium]|nr:ribokinase [Chloroflexota bacterium]